jgi:hypothetical protein
VPIVGPRCFGPDEPSGMLKRLLSPEFSQFIETGSTLSEVNEYGGVVEGLRFSRRFPQGGVSRTADARGIEIVFMHKPVKRTQQFFLQIH